MPTFPHASFLDRLLAELPYLLRAARRLTRSEQDAEDLAQATVVRAIERHADLRDEDRMRAWLLRIERSVLLNATRGARQRLEVIEDGRGAESVPEPQGNLEAELLERGFAEAGPSTPGRASQSITRTPPPMQIGPGAATS
ncbi:RNA polymerase sigma factor [Sorangium sp. So ce388]|uniref:RNA polymerase sigma factor n=1 Tax=Sorangium sp. So ce388 TaxID=3133309 RepID=UPI003F5C5432